MNKIISTKDRLFMSIVGPSGCGKSHLIFDMLRSRTFFLDFDKVLYFFKHSQPLFEQMSREFPMLEFIGSLDFDLIDNLPDNGTNYLLVFDDSCQEIYKSQKFIDLATAGRHKKLSCIYIKHNLFHKSSNGRDIDLQNTHIVLFKSPRDVQQVKVLSRQLGIGRQLVDWYIDATTKPFGHLMIDLSPKTDDLIRYCTNCTSFPSQFYLPSSRARQCGLNDQTTELLYSEALFDFQQNPPKNFPQKMFQRLSSFSM